MIVCRRIKLSIERRVQLRSINAARLHGRVFPLEKRNRFAVFGTTTTNTCNLSRRRSRLHSVMMIGLVGLAHGAYNENTVLRIWRMCRDVKSN